MKRCCLVDSGDQQGRKAKQLLGNHEILNLVRAIVGRLLVYPVADTGWRCTGQKKHLHAVQHMPHHQEFQSVALRPVHLFGRLSTTATDRHSPARHGDAVAAGKKVSCHKRAGIHLFVVEQVCDSVTQMRWSWLEDMTDKVPELQLLVVYCEGRNSCISSLVPRFRQLHTLKMVFSPLVYSGVTGSLNASVISECKSLVTLFCEHCDIHVTPQLTSTCVEKLALRHSNIIPLNLVQVFPRLTHFFLERHDVVSPQYLDLLVACPHLRCLEFADATAVACIDRVAACPSLREVYLHNARQETWMQGYTGQHSVFSTRLPGLGSNTGAVDVTLRMREPNEAGPMNYPHGPIFW